MKKITVLFAALFVLALASCTSKTDVSTEATAVDTTAVAVDTAAVATVDTTAVDTTHVK